MLFSEPSGDGGILSKGGEEEEERIYETFSEGERCRGKIE